MLSEAKIKQALFKNFSLTEIQTKKYFAVMIDDCQNEKILLQTLNDLGENYAKSSGRLKITPKLIIDTYNTNFSYAMGSVKDEFKCPHCHNTGLYLAIGDWNQFFPLPLKIVPHNNLYKHQLYCHCSHGARIGCCYDVPSEMRKKYIHDYSLGLWDDEKAHREADGYILACTELYLAKEGLEPIKHNNISPDNQINVKRALYKMIKTTVPDRFRQKAINICKQEFRKDSYGN